MMNVFDGKVIIHLLHDDNNVNINDADNDDNECRH